MEESQLGHANTLVRTPKLWAFKVLYGQSNSSAVGNKKAYYRQ